MGNLLSLTRNAVLTLSFIFGTQAFAETPKNDAQTIEEMNKFADESAKMRETHIQQMREVHVKHINEMYDRKLAHNKEMTLLWKQMKPGDKKANKELKSQIKDKHKAFDKEDEAFRDDFKENVLKKKNKEFREIMHNRMKEMKEKYKD
ncbi:hypothetical protein SHI21_11145 [Bacteriovorax sp. PP10]|uniref:LTXXQ motif family protein n=1 Tax=Bacteriovorax antarcticus TaxID=3088717 RepID=A0ABU5VUN5_9BACT|nr:hypothetical protein [Bacteriovorax sp. PP10]MEA9356766.1 hypothetical protein [Bacteriovorax sp. PP10]